MTCEGPDTASTVSDAPGDPRFLLEDTHRQLRFFRASLTPDGGFDILGHDGVPIGAPVQALHTTTRLVHSYALGIALGARDCEAIVDAGMAALLTRHRDPVHGGYAAEIAGCEIADGRKFAYGHAFVLLAAASAAKIGHPDADALFADIAEVLGTRFLDPVAGRLREEFERDWTPFSSYRGMNANMHGTEAMLAAYEASGERVFLDRAAAILDFFLLQVACRHEDRVPEHYDEDWRIDPDYRGDPMFRPAGTTPGHSFEWARLLLQAWELKGRPDDGSPSRARALVERAWTDGWDAKRGGIVYTLRGDGAPDVTDRYWWPVTEAIGAFEALRFADARPQDEARLESLWRFARATFVDEARGGWYPEIDDGDRPVGRLFTGKPDIYHSLQAVLLPLAGRPARLAEALAARRGATADG